MNDVMCAVLAKYDDIFTIFADRYIEKIKSPLLVVDDGLSAEVKQRYQFRYVPAPKPFAFCLSFNVALQETHPLDVIVFNDDCLIETVDTDKILQSVAYAEQEIGLVAPMMDNVQNQEQWPENVQVGDYVITDNPISFTCVYLKCIAVDEVGLLDEEYRHGIAEREDIDYSLRLKREGYKLAIAQCAFVRHGGPEFGRGWSNSRARAGQLEKSRVNREYFDKKWGTGANG